MDDRWMNQKEFLTNISTARRQVENWCKALDRDNYTILLCIMIDSYAYFHDGEDPVEMAKDVYENVSLVNRALRRM